MLLNAHVLISCLCSIWQFADIQSLTALYSTSWPGVDISNDASAAGNLGSSWNYGSNFGGGTGSPTVHGGTDGGMYGDMGTNEIYTITLCPGTAGAVCAG
mmetsp:Transcript_64803/g.104897  ORF Transcript_64803/g.104897 Transcript_64803/m.104897 type:complete len:100 (-) Transcript_64803:113-412(-)